MKLYEATIKPLSSFGTPLMGDTIFGHFCWQVAYDQGLLNGGLNRWIACYEERPFAVFSSAWPKLSKNSTRYALRKPALPGAIFHPERVGEDKKKLIADRKELLKKQWMVVGRDLAFSLDEVEYKTDHELLELIQKVRHGSAQPWASGYESVKYISKFDKPRNGINRLTSKTGEGLIFSAESASYYYPGTELSIFVLFEEEATDIDRIAEGLKRIGKWGYGKNASSGLGWFELTGNVELSLSKSQCPNACYTLAPCVPPKNVFSDYRYNLFVRLGKHGDVLARSGYPLKNPVVMAGEGGVFFPRNSEVFKRPYIGRAVMNTSKALPQSVVQGYAPYLPFRMEV